MQWGGAGPISLPPDEHCDPGELCQSWKQQNSPTAFCELQISILQRNHNTHKPRNAFSGFFLGSAQSQKKDALAYERPAAAHKCTTEGMSTLKFAPLTPKLYCFP